MGKLYKCSECEELLERDKFYTDTTKRGITKKCKVCFDIFTEYKEKEKIEHCNWCFGYGVFPHDGVPLGIHEVKQGFPSKPCPVCKADYRDKKRSVIRAGCNPSYPW